MAATALGDVAVVLNREDDVAVARIALSAGTALADAGDWLTVRADVPPGHKVARRAVPAGAPVRRYGQVIGFATAAIEPGDHVHTHNLAFRALARDYEVGADVRPVERYPPEAMRTFDGYRRADGRVGTRNYVAVVSTVSARRACASS